MVVLSFILAGLLGVGVGFLMKVFFFYGFVVLGAIAGYFLGNMIYNLILINFVKNAGALFATSFGLSIILAFLCYKRKD